MKAALIAAPSAKASQAVKLVHDYAEPAAPGPGKVIVKTLCSALNHLDLWMGKGMMGPTIKYPAVSGCDACGVVETLGPGVDAAWKGKRVILNAAVDQGDAARPGDPPAISTPNWHLIGEQMPGTHMERFVAPVANLQAVGDDQDPVEAAAFGLTALTAYSMMVTKAGLKPGQSVLVTGIGGGVALAALAIAKQMGCPVVVTSRHQGKLDRAKALGADHGVLDTGADWSGAVRAWSGKRGVDLAVDSSGKATHLWCIKSLARGGTYVSPGATSGGDATTDLSRIFWMQLRILGSTMGSNTDFAQVAALYRAGALRPVVDKVFPAAKVADAYAYLESAEQFGKVVIDWR